MEKVIFMVINMNVGGTEKALLNMIEQMPKEKYDITILMLEKHGGFLNSIPNHVHVECLDEYNEIKEFIHQPPKSVILNQFKKRKIVSGLILIYIYFILRMTNNNSLLFKYVLKDVSYYKSEYSKAIAYAGPMDFISYFVIHKINAKKKIQWIHFDVSKIGFNKGFASEVYNKFDQIFVVSHEGKDKLMERLPRLTTKVDTFTNPLSCTQLQMKSRKGTGFEDQFKGIRILTVGRLSKEKGQDLIIPVLAELKANGFDVRWYCVGEGSARVEYEELIKSIHVENDFILLGEKTNPYPYMKECDIYVQPSRHEGYCITLSEVKCFGKPIISTKFTGVHEHIIDGETGSIVHFDQEEMYDAIVRTITSEEVSSQSITN